MADRQYDVSEEFLELVKRKQQQRNENKAYFKRLVSNPYRKEGILYDPIVQRYHAMSAYAHEYYKPTFKSTIGGFCIFVVPLMVMFCSLKYYKGKQERSYRNGEVAYKDRKHKLTGL